MNRNLRTRLNVFGRWFVLSALLSVCQTALGVNGSELWLTSFKARPVTVTCTATSPVLNAAKEELQKGWLGTPGATVVLSLGKDKLLRGDGYRLDSFRVTAVTDKGILYGVFDLLRRQRTGDPIKAVLSNPSYQFRLLNHWDNQDGSIERGYAGKSIFWRPGSDSLTVTDADIARWKEYARANASVGINGAVLNNVNANPKVLSVDYLKRAAAIAEVVRPYGMKVYLSINFAAPIRLGGLKTADPLDKNVIAWWKAKVKEVYRIIPDFGGFLVKANSEGQAGPQDYGRTHVDGANMLADALKPFGGIVMWRAFVYNPNDKDRAKQAYNEFLPFDGKFRSNVIIQVKNGPIDFQPREPFSPLFGAMKKTSVMPELQITQEYLGHSYQLVYLAPMWEETLQSDTYRKGMGSTVARCTDGSIYKQSYTAICGVSNIGLDANWCGNVFAPSNWYAFGRLAWDNKLTSSKIAMEWLKQTFDPSQAAAPTTIRGNKWQTGFLIPVMNLMLQTREACVNYSMPLGLHHIFSGNEHYGPGPWYAPKGVRKDWTPPYYHQADSLGIGFDRTKTGTDAVSQYAEPFASQLNDVATCPENLLLWFHHLPWDYRMKDGRTLWDELCSKYDKGVKNVRALQVTWDRMQPYVDAERFAGVQSLLRRHTRDAQIWKDACILYFQQFSRRPIPFDVERPIYDLETLMAINPLNTIALPSAGGRMGGFGGPRTPAAPQAVH
jgi:alpha-glucuronidase